MRRDPSCENLPRICCPSRERRRGELWAARHITGHGGALTLGFQPAAGAKKISTFLVIFNGVINVSARRRRENFALFDCF